MTLQKCNKCYNLYQTRITKSNNFQLIVSFWDRIFRYKTVLHCDLICFFILRVCILHTRKQNCSKSFRYEQKRDTKKWSFLWENETWNFLEKNISCFLIVFCCLMSFGGFRWKNSEVKLWLLGSVFLFFLFRGFQGFPGFIVGAGNFDLNGGDWVGDGDCVHHSWLLIIQLTNSTAIKIVHPFVPY